MNVRIDGVSLSDGHETPPPTPVYRIPQSQDMDGDTTHDQQPSSSRPSSPNSTLPQSSPSQPNEHSQAHHAEDKKGSKLLSRTKKRLLRTWDPNLILENSGSVARDHLASERTFLAYMRTSLTIASTGVALVQLFTLSAETNSKALERFSRPLGAVIIVIGFGVLLMGLVRYFMIQNALVGGTYPVARVGIILLSVVMAAITVVVFGIIVGVR